MENSSIDGGIEPTGTESKIPLILAIAAFVLGGLSFIFAFNTKSGLERMKTSLQKEVAEAAEEAKQSAALARNMSAGNDGVSAIKTDLAQFESSVKADYRTLANSQAEVIKRTNELTSRLAQLEQGRRSAPAATPASRAGNNTPATGTQTAAATTSGGKYTVKQGDNPGKIARELGITTKALMDANPGLDPKRLQIGQKLNVPERR